MTDEGVWLTPEAHEKLTAELEHLRTEGRAGMEIRLAEARSHGDIRENADYDAAKNDQGIMEARIRQLERLLATARVQEAGETDQVVIGSVVTVVEGDGEETEYFVATPENRAPGYLLASPAGPLGKALLGARPGDSVTYAAPGGSFTVTIKAVRPFRG
jgi:transcription elongation factor GreA